MGRTDIETMHRMVRLIGKGIVLQAVGILRAIGAGDFRHERGRALRVVRQIGYRLPHFELEIDINERQKVTAQNCRTVTLFIFVPFRLKPY